MAGDVVYNRISVPRRLSPSWLAYQGWRDQLFAMLDARFYTPEWLDNEVFNGRIRCWDSENAAILATLRTYPTGAAEVHGVAAVGGLEAIKALIPKAEAWGLQHGAIVSSIASRAAWSRALESQGYVPYKQEIRKELSIERPFE